jgi:hypothetical protein
LASTGLPGITRITDDAVSSGMEYCFHFPSSSSRWLGLTGERRKLATMPMPNAISTVAASLPSSALRRNSPEELLCFVVQFSRRLTYAHALSAPQSYETWREDVRTGTDQERCSPYSVVARQIRAPDVGVPAPPFPSACSSMDSAWRNFVLYAEPGTTWQNH